MHDMQVLITVK